MVGGALGVALLAGVQLAPNASAAGVTTLYYSSAGAPDYVTQIDQAAANWNAAVTDIRLVEGGSATIVFHETDDGQGSYTSTDGHGHGQIYLDRQQVAEGFAPTRIAAHELGHNLGLSDDYSGPCSEIMSGHGPGTSCTNAVPDAAEAAQVQQNWANGFTPAKPEKVVG
ncbi:snapalysin family zinc-dependent metalloprotease [Amycolatopsis alkalitolerans]|uniref:Extracellular small neutral protease n=1 Tax=Amycolatopsis alkalitolerans TaxID=2547244 RepID=A0A5C4LUW2_9PSEU|nr:snapalysin family zinc-dependent metalloprotease [Amycolatopsis alkalitolerans]TNC23069.1 snapalysin family zinc-dependent metalloprotease [Amycolatopsis alkalitolerans]